MKKYIFYSLLVLSLGLTVLFSGCEKSGIGSLTIKTCVVPNDSDGDVLTGYFMKNQDYEVTVTVFDNKDANNPVLVKQATLGKLNFPNTWNTDFTINTNRFKEIDCFNDLPPGKKYIATVDLVKTLGSGSTFDVPMYLGTSSTFEIVKGQKKVLTIECNE